jgi:hypothetical protein
MAEIHFRSMEASNIENDVTFHSWLAVTLPEFSIYLFRSKVMQGFHVFAAVKNHFQFLVANMTPKFFWKSRHPQKALL